MDKNYVNELVKLCLDMAELADRTGEISLNQLGLGRRAFSCKLRDGAREIISLQAAYHREAERAKYSEMGEKDARDFLEDVFGDRDVDEISNEEKQSIKAFVQRLSDEDLDTTP